MPQLVLILIFLLGLINGLIQSFGILPSLGMTKPTLMYYKNLLTDKSFLHSILFSVYISFTSSVLAVVGGTILCSAMVLTRKNKGTSLRFVQIPVIVPHVVVALFIINIFSQSGLLARIIYSMGFIQSQTEFPDLLFSKGGIGIIMAYIWKEIPFVAFFVVAIMSEINNNLGEAAMNLGANPLYAFYHVTLPMCLPAIKNAFIIILAFSFGAYELPFLLGATTPKALPVKAYIEYINPDFHNRPNAMAINSIMLVISLLIALLYYQLMEKNIQRTKEKI